MSEADDKEKEEEKPLPDRKVYPLEDDEGNPGAYYGVEDNRKDKKDLEGDRRIAPANGDQKQPEDDDDKDGLWSSGD